MWSRRGWAFCFVQVKTYRLKITQHRRNLQTLYSSEDLLSVSVSQIKRSLRSHMVPYKEGFTCLAIQDCPIDCSDRKQDKKFYINKITGLFVCHACGRSGPWDWLEQRLVDKQKSANSSLTAMPRNSSVPEPSSQCQPVASVDSAVLKLCLKKLNLSHVPAECLSSLGACIETEESRLLLPLRGPDLAVGAWRSLVPPQDGDKRPTEETLGLRPSAMASSLLLLSSVEAGSSQVVIVPTAADLLALASQNVPAIYLAAGVGHLPQEVLPSLEHFTELTLWFGEHTDAARTYARKLGESRCQLVRPSATLSGAHEEMSLKGHRAALASTVRSAQPVSHPSITTFAALRDDVLSEISREDIVRGVPWKRFPQLTEILGGFRRGELSVITGPTGSGKTTFMSEYSLDLCLQGVNTLWGSFEIRNSRLARTMLTQLAGLKLEDHLDKFEELADRMEQLPLHFMAFHGQQPLKAVMEAVGHAAYVHDLGHVVVDNVQFMLGLTEEGSSNHMDRFYRQDMVIESFRRFATHNNCHVTLVIHPRKEQANELLTTASIFGGAKATQEADNVLLLQDQTLASIKGKKFLQIAKNRYNGELGIMQLDFDRDSLSFVRKKKAANVAAVPLPVVPVMPVPSFLRGNYKVIKPATNN